MFPNINKGAVYSSSPTWKRLFDIRSHGNKIFIIESHLCKISKVIVKQHIPSTEYDTLVNDLSQGRQLIEEKETIEDRFFSRITLFDNAEYQQSLPQMHRLQQ